MKARSITFEAPIGGYFCRPEDALLPCPVCDSMAKLGPLYPVVPGDEERVGLMRCGHLVEVEAIRKGHWRSRPARPEAIASHDKMTEHERRLRAAADWDRTSVARWVYEHCGKWVATIAEVDAALDLADRT